MYYVERGDRDSMEVTGFIYCRRLEPIWSDSRDCCYNCFTLLFTLNLSLFW
jgi:hypothetical protein